MTTNDEFIERVLRLLEDHDKQVGEYVADGGSAPDYQSERWAEEHALVLVARLRDCAARLLDAEKGIAALRERVAALEADEIEDGWPVNYRRNPQRIVQGKVISRRVRPVPTLDDDDAAPQPTPRDYLTNLVRSFYNNSEANATVDFHVNRLLKTFALPMRSDQILHVLAIALDLYIFIQYLEIHAHRDDPSFDVNAVPHTPVLEALEEYGATLFFYLTVAYRTEGVPALAIQTLATPAYVSQWAHRHLGLTLPNFWPQGFMQSEGDPDER